MSQEKKKICKWLEEEISLNLQIHSKRTVKISLSNCSCLQNLCVDRWLPIANFNNCYIFYTELFTGIIYTQFIYKQFYRIQKTVAIVTKKRSPIGQYWPLRKILIGRLVEGLCIKTRVWEKQKKLFKNLAIINIYYSRYIVKMIQQKKRRKGKVTNCLETCAWVTKVWWMEKIDWCWWEMANILRFIDNKIHIVYVECLLQVSCNGQKWKKKNMWKFRSKSCRHT